MSTPLARLRLSTRILPRVSVPSGFLPFDIQFAVGKTVKAGRDAIAPDEVVRLGQLSQFSITTSQLMAATLPASAKSVRTNGYASPGDGGESTLRRVATQPAHPGRFRSQDRFLPDGSVSQTDGGWWEIVDRFVDLRAHGAVANALTDQSAIIQDWGNHLVARSAIGTVSGVYRCNNVVINGRAAIFGTNLYSDGFKAFAINQPVLIFTGTRGPVISSLLFEGFAGATSGDLLRVTDGAASQYGAEGARISNCYFLYGYNQINLEKAYQSEVTNNAMLFFEGAGCVVNNAATLGTASRSWLTKNLVIGKGAFGSRASLFGFLQIRGADVWYTDNWCFNLATMIGIQPAAGAAIFNITITGNQGYDLNLGIYMDSTTGTLPQGVPASLSNVNISNNRIQALQCVLTSGVVTNGTISGNETFPYVNGIGFNAKLNGFQCVGNHVDATPLGGGTGAGTTGWILQADSYQTIILGTVFSGVAAPFNIVATDKTTRVAESVYVGDNDVTVTYSVTSSPFVAPSGVARRTLYFQNPGGVTSVQQRGTTIFTNAPANAPITIDVASRDNVQFFFSNTTNLPTAFAVINR